MKKALFFAVFVAFAIPATSVAQDEPVKKGFKPSGEPITNPAEPGYDPDVIVCRMEDRTGSRAKRREVCLANHRWQRVAREGNGFARALVEGSRGGGTMGVW